MDSKYEYSGYGVLWTIWVRALMWIVDSAKNTMRINCGFLYSRTRKFSVIFFLEYNF